MTARNAERNDAGGRDAASARGREPEPLLARAPWDLVLASDVLYEPRNGDALLPLLPRLLGPRGEVWLADPGRVPAAAVPRGRADDVFAIQRRPVRELPQGGVYVLRLSPSPG